MKKIFKIISLVMMMVMCFSVTAFAAETDETSNLKVSFTDEGMINTVDEDVTPGISVRAPAPAVSSVKVVAAQIKSDGYVYVTVQVDVYKRQILNIGYLLSGIIPSTKRYYTFKMCIRDRCCCL